MHELLHSNWIDGFQEILIFFFLSIWLDQEILAKW